MNDYLAHYGVKGQKWGVRRYVNPDGTLTEEGKRKYGYTDAHTGGNERQRSSLFSIKKSPNKTKALTKNTKPKKIDEETKQKAKKVLAVSASVALGAAIAYKVSTKMRDNARSEMFEKARNAPLPELSKHWDDKSFENYAKAKADSTLKSMNDMTRRKAVASYAKKKVESVKPKKSSSSQSSTKDLNKVLEERLRALEKENAKRSSSAKKAAGAFDQLDELTRKMRKR